MLPSEAAKDLDNDPSHSALVCLELLTYSRFKGDIEARGDVVRDAWKGTVMLKEYEQNVFEIHHERLHKFGRHQSFEKRCPLCQAGAHAAQAHVEQPVLRWCRACRMNG